jgi:Glycosyl hydrolases family 43/Carbohydrate binding module (family 35)
MKTHSVASLISICIFFLIPHVHAELEKNNPKPLISHVYAADPSAHVWKNDPNTLYLYTSHDQPGTNTHATMSNYHVFSTKDLISWIDHGQVLSLDDVSWATTHAWAIDAIHYRGTYYLIYCMKEKGSGMFRTGIAKSDLPVGPFSDIGYIKGVEWGQDPAIFLDDDNRVYLYWGAGGKAYGAELNDDLLSIKPETLKNLTPELKFVFEGPWVHKYNNKYYLSYPGLTNGSWPEEMYYATADSPLGPYKTEGIYIPKFPGQAGTNHGSIVKFQNKWLAFHHAMIVSEGLSEVRNLMADVLTYDKNGKINTIYPSEKSISNGMPINATISLEAETAPQQGGKLIDVKKLSDKNGFSGRGYISQFATDESYVRFLVQVAKPGKYGLSVTYAAESKTDLHILVNEYQLNGTYDKPRQIILPATTDFKNYYIEDIPLKAGDNFVTIKSNSADLMLDKILINVSSK